MSTELPDRVANLPHHQILLTMASMDSWVSVDFYGKEAPTQAEIYRTIELLCLMHNGWDAEKRTE